MKPSEIAEMMVEGGGYGPRSRAYIVARAYLRLREAVSRVLVEPEQVLARERLEMALKQDEEMPRTFFDWYEERTWRQPSGTTIEYKDLRAAWQAGQKEMRERAAELLGDEDENGNQIRALPLEENR